MVRLRLLKHLRRKVRRFYSRSASHGKVKVKSSPKPFAICRLATRVAFASRHSSPVVSGERASMAARRIHETPAPDRTEINCGDMAVSTRSEMARKQPKEISWRLQIDATMAVSRTRTVNHSGPQKRARHGAPGNRSWGRNS